MAIVFDTQAELEAFCEMFELRSFEEAHSNRKFRHRVNHTALVTEIEEELESEDWEETTSPSLHLISDSDEDTHETELQIAQDLLKQPPLWIASAS